MLISKSSLLLIVSSTLALSLPVPEEHFRLVKRPGGSPTSFSLVERPTIRNGDTGVVSAAVTAEPVTGWGKSARGSTAESAVEAVVPSEWKRAAEAEVAIEAQPEWKCEAEPEPQYDTPFHLVKRPIGGPTSAFPDRKPQPHKRESEPEPQSDSPKGGWKPSTAVVGADGPKGTWKRFAEPRPDGPHGTWKPAAVVKAAGLPNQGWKRSPEEEG